MVNLLIIRVKSEWASPRKLGVDDDGDNGSDRRFWMEDSLTEFPYKEEVVQVNLLSISDEACNDMATATIAY